MNNNPIRVLLIEDNPADARLIEVLLEGVRVANFTLRWEDHLGEGLARLAGKNDFDAVLLDLSLPDSQGLDTIVKVRAQAPDIPLVILTGLDDESLGLSAVQWGAQDYLVKGHADGNLVARCLLYSIERQRMQATLRNLSLTDPLTGLYNRRGLAALGKQQLKTAWRNKSSLSVVLGDLDGLKRINDTLGHEQGDAAILEIAKAMKQTFRQSDILARLGGDEFAALLPDGSQKAAKALTHRLQQHLRELNKNQDRPYQLSISVGTVTLPADQLQSLDDLITWADALMYEEKGDHKNKREAESQPPIPKEKRKDRVPQGKNVKSMTEGTIAHPVERR